MKSLMLVIQIIVYLKKINFDYNTLKKFASKDPDFVLTFYGGEPLMQIPDIKKIDLKNFKFIKYNGCEIIP